MRFVSLDLMRFLAVLLVINSHMDGLYGNLKILATGGAIGDGLFLFCSGYILALSRRERFDNWYKNKVARIYPSVYAGLMIGTVAFGVKDVSIVQFFGGEFVIALMLYYALLYVFLMRFRGRLQWLLGAILLGSLVVYIFLFKEKYGMGENGIYGTATLFRWVPYFGFMVMGALACTKTTVTKTGGGIALIKSAVAGAAFYGMLLVMKSHPVIMPLQIFTIIPLMLCVYWLYEFCESKFSAWLSSQRQCWSVVMFISSLSLESYLVQSYVFSRNGMLPSIMNVLGSFVLIVILAFVSRTLARFLLQTFRSEKYDWLRMVKSV